MTIIVQVTNKAMLKIIVTHLKRTHFHNETFQKFYFEITGKILFYKRNLFK